MTALKHLFTPGKIGKLEIKNRVLQAPMGTMSYDAEGTPSQQTLDYFAERARGEVGLIICHAVRVVAESKTVGLPNLFDDSYIPKMAAIARAVHDVGGKIALQVNHTGRAQATNPIGPSPVRFVHTGLMPYVLTKADIHRMVEAYSDAARRVMQAGFDMVEIHGAHGYLISSFLSPFTNRRSDEYGGSRENRARFLCQIIERIRDKIGADFPLSVRFNGADLLPGGTTIEDSLAQVPLFEKAGASMLHVSAGGQENCEVQFLSYLWPDAYITGFAAAIKKVVKIPVCAVGKLGDPLVAERVLEEGKADFVSLGRALLADPYWAAKARQGKLDEINRCIYCNNCKDRLFTLSREQHRPFCTVNPALFREKEYAVTKAGKAKKVMVIGGGVAGMQAAKVAAARGHSVTLYEAGGELGGAWNIAASIPGKEIYAQLTRQLNRGLKETGVKIVLNRKVDAGFVAGEKPDAVIIATGAEPCIPNLPGAERAVQAVDIVSGKAKSGENVVVIGGRMIGMETALFLAERGKKVSIVTLKRLGENGHKLEENIYRTLRDRLIKRGVQIFPGTPALEIRPDGVFADDGGNLLWLPADTVVLASGYRCVTDMVDSVRALVREVYTIGDCNAPRDALEATREGMEAGLKI